MDKDIARVVIQAVVIGGLLLISDPMHLTTFVAVAWAGVAGYRLATSRAQQ